MLTVPDFSKAKIGTLVKRSPHCIREMRLKGKDKYQLGIIVGLDYHLDTKVAVVAWPDIHWEGNQFGSVTHPANAVPYRKRDRLPEIEISDEEPN